MASANGNAGANREMTASYREWLQQANKTIAMHRQSQLENEKAATQRRERAKAALANNNRPLALSELAFAKSHDKAIETSKSILKNIAAESISLRNAANRTAARSGGGRNRKKPATAKRQRPRRAGA